MCIGRGALASAGMPSISAVGGKYWVSHDRFVAWTNGALPAEIRAFEVLSSTRREHRVGMSGPRYLFFYLLVPVDLDVVLVSCIDFISDSHVHILGIPLAQGSKAWSTKRGAARTGAVQGAHGSG